MFADRHRNALPPLINGGAAGAIAAALALVAGGALTQVLVMAELASMVAILSPPRFVNFLSSMTGWVTTIAWQAACASTIWVAASIIRPFWHGILIFYAIVAVSVLFTTALSRIFPSLEAFVLVLHVLGFFSFRLTYLYLALKRHHQVNAQSVLVRAVTIMWAFNVVDGTTHMAEEVENAATVIPYSMILTVLINGSAGFSIFVTFIFCMGSLEDVLKDTFSFPFITVLLRITNSVANTTALISFITILSISSVIGQLATASRMLWAFAREDGIEPRTALPLNAIGVTALISLLLALLNLGSSVAFYALTGLTVARFYSGFMVSASIMLWHRITIPVSKIARGPFRLDYLGIPITVIALLYGFIGWFFSFWPPVSGQALTVQTFNWSTVVYMGIMLLSMGHWVLRARHIYKGPKIELDT
ncbi:hypothetical protein BS50DRAFT_604565 [Corynespora cassiicola Philippines]|uniref:Amino acid transporter n=1 Tax=Corynespora cassiicola Philippines TaxID=1448308 RepID=A0A2T2N5Q2_CORCC|nr:hypothetical protein BS50DRAFT_604565 [Corynespora cassiicola Philippines]